MIIRYLYILLFAFILNQGAAQESYDDKELQNFVEVYMSFKDIKKRNTDKDKEIFDKYNVTPARYREISQSSLSQKPTELNASEKHLLKEIQKQNELLKASNLLLLEKLCTEQEISHTKYSTILDQFKTDIQFQRSLKPYFDKYINQLK